jgi:hypothetical protein
MLKLLLLLLIPGLAMASKGGGGGLVVACYQGEELTKVELLDLYEGRAKGLVFSNLSGDFKKDVAEIASKMFKNQRNAGIFVTQLNKIISTYRFIPEDAELELTNDAFPAFLPRGCKAKQVANYYNDRLVWIDSILFNKMSYQDRLALAFHETIYFLERIYRPSTDSRYTRKVVAHVFNRKDDFDPPSTDYDFYCYPVGDSSGRSIPYTSFLSKKAKSNNDGEYEISFIMINGHYVYTKKVAKVMINPLVAEGRPAPETAYDPYLVSSAKISSNINPGEQIVLMSNENQIIFDWHGTDPGDFIRGATFQCMSHHPAIEIFPFVFLE